MAVAARLGCTLVLLGCATGCGHDPRVPVLGAERHGQTLTILLGCVDVSDADIRLEGNTVRVSVHGERIGGDCQATRDVELTDDAPDQLVVINGDRCWAGAQGELAPAICVDA